MGSIYVFNAQNVNMMKKKSQSLFIIYFQADLTKSDNSHNNNKKFFSKKKEKSCCILNHI